MINDTVSHYKKKLPISARKCYDVILRDIRSYSSVIICPRTRRLQNVLDAVNKDNPDLFYVDWHNNGICDKTSKYYDAINIGYLYDSIQKVQIEEELKRIERGFLYEDSVWAKVFAIFNYVTENVTYNIINKTGANIVDALIVGTAVCQGIAFSIKYLLGKVGIHCYVICGDVNYESGFLATKHMWNIVEVNGRYYHLDATADLCANKNYHTYDYFLISDKEIRKTHSFEGKICKEEHSRESYFAKHNLLLSDSSFLKAKLQIEDFSNVSQFCFCPKNWLPDVKEVKDIVIACGSFANFQVVSTKMNNFYIRW